MEKFEYLFISLAVNVSSSEESITRKSRSCVYRNNSYVDLLVQSLYFELTYTLIDHAFWTSLEKSCIFITAIPQNLNIIIGRNVLLIQWYTCDLF